MPKWGKRKDRAVERYRQKLQSEIAQMGLSAAIAYLDEQVREHEDLIRTVRRGGDEPDCDVVYPSGTVAKATAALRVIARVKKVTIDTTGEV